MSKLLEKQVARRKITKEELQEAYNASQHVGKHILPSGDIHRPPGSEQNFLVLSYVTPDGSTRVTSLKGICFKFSGTFRLLEDAKNHAQTIRDENPMFDVSVVDLYTWGVIPLPDEERPFVAKEYTDPLLTRAISGLQKSMTQGKKELEERKARDRAKAEAQMQKVRGKDYKMPEKGADILALEEKVKKERKAEEEAAAAEHRESQVVFNMSQISNIIMTYCTESIGKSIDMGSGVAIMKYFTDKSIELEAQYRRAKASEFQDEAPGLIPTAADLEHMSKEDVLAPDNIDSACCFND
jgi:hypothetical protein